MARRAILRAARAALALRAQKRQHGVRDEFISARGAAHARKGDMRESAELPLRHDSYAAFRCRREVAEDMLSSMLSRRWRCWRYAAAATRACLSRYRRAAAV